MVVSEEKLLKYLNNIKVYKSNKAKEYSVEHPYHNVYSAEAVLAKQLLNGLRLVAQMKKVTNNE